MGPDNGQARTRLPFSHTLIMWILLHTFVGAPYLFNRWGRGAVSDGDASPGDACVGEFLRRVCCVLVCERTCVPITRH